MDLIEDLSQTPLLEEEPLTDEENALIDHWIATEASSREQARIHGRSSLGMVARRQISSARVTEVTMLAQGAPWWVAASVADRIKWGLDPD